MPKKGGNISLSSYDDIFQTDQSREEDQQERVQEIPLSELHPFKGHPFKVLDDEAMQKTVESIAQFGVMTPAIARPRPASLQIFRREAFIYPFSRNSLLAHSRRCCLVSLFSFCVSCFKGIAISFGNNTPLIESIPCLQAVGMHSMDEFIIVKKAFPRNGKRLCLHIRLDTLIYKSACFAV